MLVKVPQLPFSYRKSQGLASADNSSVHKEEGFGSILTVAICYGLAIGLAITFVGPTSGAHLSPGVTLSFAVFKGFPWRKVPHYIIAQLLGGFVAALLVYAQFSQQLSAIAKTFEAAGMDIFTPCVHTPSTHN